MEAAISLHQELDWHLVRLSGSAAESLGETAFKQEAYLGLLAHRNEGFAALGMGAQEPSSALAHCPHRGIWDEDMGDHLVRGAVSRDKSRSTCEGWMELPTHMT